MGADWYVDPLGRFSGRFFDGDKWTDQVSIDGQLATDPDWPPSQPVIKSEPKPQVQRRGMMIPERRETGDRRQINTPRNGLPERRKGDRRTRAIVIPKA